MWFGCELHVRYVSKWEEVDFKRTHTDGMFSITNCVQIAIRNIAGSIVVFIFAVYFDFVFKKDSNQSHFYKNSLLNKV